MILRVLTETWAKVLPNAQSTVLLVIRVSMGWGFFLTAHREDAFLPLSDFTDQAPFSFLMAALVTFAFGAGKFSIDRLLQPWFDRITRYSRIFS